KVDLAIEDQTLKRYTSKNLYSSIGGFGCWALILKDKLPRLLRNFLPLIRQRPATGLKNIDEPFCHFLLHAEGFHSVFEKLNLVLIDDIIGEDHQQKVVEDVHLVVMIVRDDDLVFFLVLDNLLY